MNRQYLRLLACMVSGLGFVLVSPPIGWHGLHWVMLVPALLCLQAGEHRANAKLGYLCGWVGLFAAFSWIINTIVLFSNMPWVMGLLVHCIFATAFAIPYALVFGTVHWFRERWGMAWVLLFPTMQVATEHLSPALFPHHHGATMYRFAEMWQITSVTGVMGLTWLIFFANAAIAELAYRRREGRSLDWRPMIAVATLLIANLGFGHWRHGAVEAELKEAHTVDVGIVQTDITMDLRLEQDALTILRTWMELTREAATRAPDLLVWPEGAIPFNPHSESPVTAFGGISTRAFFEEVARSGGFDLLIGGGSHDEDPDAPRGFTAFNSAQLFTRAGVLKGRYDKMVPLPFGEYVPLSDTFPVLKDLVEGPGDFMAGETPTFFEGSDRAGQGYTFSAPICYEAIIDRQMWKLLGPGAGVDFFVNLTNDAWFGDTAEPWQHGMMAAVQATQFGRPLIRSTYTGVSFVAEPHGDILHETQPFQRAWWVEPVRLGKIRTLYIRGGWLFPWLCVAVALSALGLAFRRTPSTEAARE